MLAGLVDLGSASVESREKPALAATKLYLRDRKRMKMRKWKCLSDDLYVL